MRGWGGGEWGREEGKGGKEREAGRGGVPKGRQAASGRAESPKQFSGVPLPVAGLLHKALECSPSQALDAQYRIAFLSPGESLADEALIFQVKLNTGWGWGGRECYLLCTASHRKLEEPSASPGLDKPTKEEPHLDSDYCQVDRLLVQLGVEKLAVSGGRCELGVCRKGSPMSSAIQGLSPLQSPGAHSFLNCQSVRQANSFYFSLAYKTNKKNDVMTH